MAETCSPGATASRPLLLASRTLLLNVGTIEQGSAIYRPRRPFSNVKRFRTATRRNLDRRLAGAKDQLEGRPPTGWIRTIREALSMSTYELAKRVGVSQTRVRQFEAAELQGSIRLATLRRTADALGCRLLYVFVPDESLENMVLGQARCKAAARLSISDPVVLENEAQDPHELQLLQRFDDLTMELVDRPGLWS